MVRSQQPNTNYDGTYEGSDRNDDNGKGTQVDKKEGEQLSGREIGPTGRSTDGVHGTELTGGGRKELGGDTETSPATSGRR